MKITIEIEISEADCLRLAKNSIERVLNNASRVGHYAERHGNESIRDFGSTLWQDADELNGVATRIWAAAREACFRARSF